MTVFLVYHHHYYQPSSFRLNGRVVILCNRHVKKCNLASFDLPGPRPGSESSARHAERAEQSVFPQEHVPRIRLAGIYSAISLLNMIAIQSGGFGLGSRRRHRSCISVEMSKRVFVLFFMNAATRSYLLDTLLVYDFLNVEVEEV